MKNANKPILYKNLFKYNKYESLEDAKKQIGDIQLLVSNTNYYDGHKSGFVQMKLSLAEYLTSYKSTHQCTEERLTEDEARRLHMPTPEEVAQYSDVDRYLFIGRKGDVAPMHFDWDFKQVLLVQHYGRKRVVLFSPKFSKRFLPVANMSFIAFHQLSQKEQAELIKYCHGEEFVLEPGDALLIPRCWWHFIEYIDFGIGSNYRFDGGTEDRMFTSLPRHYLLDTIAYYLRKKFDAQKQQEVAARILETYFSWYRGPLERYREMIKLYDELYKEICYEAVQGDYYGKNFDFEVSLIRNEILRTYDLKTPRFIKKPLEAIIEENIRLGKVSKPRV